MTDNLGFLERSAYFLGTNPPAFRLLLSVLVGKSLNSQRKYDRLKKFKGRKSREKFYRFFFL